MKFRSAALTDIGKSRYENEDRFLCDDALGLFGVADGIGGLPGGGEAAQCTVDELNAIFKKEPADPDFVGITRAVSVSVYDLGQKINPPFGIGTTLTFGLLKDSLLHLAHVGDSRAYVLQKGDFLPLTEDHTVENEARLLRARGEDVEVSAYNRNALTRCIGQPGEPEVDFQEFAVSTGDRYFFTTDGIIRVVTDQELSDIISGPESPAAMLKIIIDLAMDRGGYDNLTGVLVFVDEA